MRAYWSLVVVAIAVTAVAAGPTPAMAQDFANIYVANRVIARIRGAGSYPSIQERAKAASAAIELAVASGDITSPQTSVREKDGLWWVYAWDTPIVAVHESETQANRNISPKALAAIWAQDLRVALPLAKTAVAAPAATPAPAAAPAPGAAPPATAAPAPEPPTAAPAPAGPAAPLATTPAPASAPAATPVASPPTAAAPPVASSAATLLILDAFRIARALPEDDFQAKRDSIAANLLTNLVPFVTGGVAPVTPLTGTPTPAQPRPPTTVAQPRPPVTAPPATVVQPKPPTTATATPSTKPAPGSIEGVPPGHENDPAYARVAQKVRIRNKLNAARAPLEALQASDPDAAKAVGDLLAACRTAFAAGKYDDAERYVDEATARLAP